MATVQQAALKVIASGPEQTEMFAFCETHGIFYNAAEPPYLTMARIAKWALLMKDAELPQNLASYSKWVSGETTSTTPCVRV